MMLSIYYSHGRITFYLPSRAFSSSSDSSLCRVNGSSFTHFETDIFSFRRIVLAPIISLAGYLLVIVAILYTEKNMK